MIRVKLKFGNSDNMPPRTRASSERTPNRQEDTEKKKETGKEEENSAELPANPMPLNLNERLMQAQKSRTHCDITFVVEGEEIHAHKLVLALASPVFEAMFYGAMAEKGDRVPIADLTAKGFELLIGYIYSNTLLLNNIEEGFQVWTAADKYCIPEAKEECSKGLRFIDLELSSVWSTYQTALFLDIKEVVHRCKSILQNKTHQVMATEDFTSVSEKVMQSFLDLDWLNCREVDLMRGLIKWGEAQVKKQNKSTLQEALKPCVKFIHFGQMKMEDFCKILDEAPEAFLECDTIAIMKHLANPDAYPLPTWWYGEKPPRSRTDPDKCKTETQNNEDASTSKMLHRIFFGKKRRHPPVESRLKRRKKATPDASSDSSTSTSTESSSSDSSSWSESDSDFSPSP